MAEMVTYEDTKRLLNLKTTRRIDAAARFLEFHGQRFCVDFGTKNAIDIAKSLKNRRKIPRLSVADVRILRKMGVKA